LAGLRGQKQEVSRTIKTMGPAVPPWGIPPKPEGFKLPLDGALVNTPKSVWKKRNTDHKPPQGLW